MSKAHQRPGTSLTRRELLRTSALAGVALWTTAKSWGGEKTGSPNAKLNLAGIGVGGRTGLTSVVVAALFGLSIFLAPIAQLVPAQATAAALIVVGVMMLAAFKDIDWPDLDQAIPAFFASIFMCLSYSISNGIAVGFVFYILIKAVKGQMKDVHPILFGATALFVVNYVLTAIF